jgi:polyphosphate glucokinase
MTPLRSVRPRLQPGGERTLTLDCGGSGLKGRVIDSAGVPVGERRRVQTPYPCPPDLLVATLVELGDRLPAFDRVSVGLPGMIRGGQVLATPHYVTEAGPFTPRRPDLVAAWTGFDAAAELAKAFACPVRVVNDAELAGLGVIEGAGFEVLLTFGTGLGAALFDNGRAVPKLELSQAPFRNGETYDEQLGNHARKAIGNDRWTVRVAKALDRWHAVLWWDRLYLGGGNAKHLGDVGRPASRISNDAAWLGGVHLWDY